MRTPYISSVPNDNVIFENVFLTLDSISGLSRQWHANDSTVFLNNFVSRQFYGIFHSIQYNEKIIPYTFY